MDEKDILTEAIRKAVDHYHDEVTVGVENLLNMVRSGEWSGEEIADSIEALLRKLG